MKKITLPTTFLALVFSLNAQTSFDSDYGNDYRDIIATRNQKATYAMVYMPQPKPVQIDLNKLSSDWKKVSWFDLTTGKYHRIKGKYSNEIQLFEPPDTQ